AGDGAALESELGGRCVVVDRACRLASRVVRAAERADEVGGLDLKAHLALLAGGVSRGRLGGIDLSPLPWGGQSWSRRPVTAERGYGRVPPHETLHRRHRPGHDFLALHAVRRGRRDRRLGPEGASADLPAAWLGRA